MAWLLELVFGPSIPENPHYEVADLSQRENGLDRRRGVERRHGGRD